MLNPHTSEGGEKTGSLHVLQSHQPLPCLQQRHMNDSSPIRAALLFGLQPTSAEETRSKALIKEHCKDQSYNQSSPAHFPPYLTPPDHTASVKTRPCPPEEEVATDLAAPLPQNLQRTWCSAPDCSEHMHWPDLGRGRSKPWPVPNQHLFPLSPHISKWLCMLLLNSLEKNYQSIASGFPCADLMAFWQSLWDFLYLIERSVQ